MTLPYFAPHALINTISDNYSGLWGSVNTPWDFSVSADPLDANRINVCEQWESRRDLMAFRESGPEDDLWSLVEYAEVP